MAAQLEPEPIPRTISVRVGRSLRLNGDDEFVHLADADISPAGAFDSPSATSAVTFGICAKFLHGNADLRQVVMSKHPDADDIAATPLDGWWIERTADNELRAVLVDGDTPPNVFSILSPQNFVFPNEAGGNEELPFFHVIFLTIDGENETMELWASLGDDQGIHSGVISLGTVALTGYVATENTDSFAIGAAYDGTPANELLLSYIDVAWAAVWDEKLPESFLRELPRFQFPTDDRRLVSAWHWTERTLDDWNRETANDLSSTGVTNDNYVLGPDREIRQGSVTAAPASGEKAGAASLVFPHFRPEPGSEGHFFGVGYSEAPPLRYRRTTVGAADPPDFTLGLSAHCTLYGRWASMANRENGGADDVWRLYDTFVVDDGADETPISGWEPESKITDGDVRNSIETWDSDRVNAPMRIFGFAAGSVGGPRFLEITGAPTTPIIAGTLVLGGAGPRQVLYDARDNDFCYLFSPLNESIHVIDVSTGGSPALDNTLTDSRLGDGSGAKCVQVGTRLYCTFLRGIQVVNIATPTAITYVTSVDTDPIGSNDDDTADIAILQSKRHLITVGSDGFASGDGVVHIWDIFTDPDLPVLVFRKVFTELDIQPFKIMRRGSIVFVEDGPGAAVHVVAFAVHDEPNPLVLANYVLRDFHDDFFGVTTFLALDRETMFFVKDTKQVGFFRIDDGYGKTSFRVDYEVPATLITNPVPKYELEKYFHDLSRWDMEDDVVGALPTGFTKIGTAASTVEVSDDFGLTGVPPTSTLKPKSLKVLLQGPDVEAGIFELLTPASADLDQGKIHVASVWYYPTDATFDPSTDLEIEIQETGGVESFNRTYSPLETTVTPHRWYRFEVIHTQNEVDTTGLTLRLRVENHVAAPVYFDALRFGPGAIFPLFSGRQLDYGLDHIELDGAGGAWTANYQDFIHDLRTRDRLGGKKYPAQSAKTTIEDVVSNFTRAKDALNTDNVSDELGLTDLLEFDKDEDPSEAVRRAASQGNGEVWIRDRQIFAEPPGFQMAPVSVNDVQPFLWEDFKIRKSIASLVTEGEIQGDQSISDKPTSSYVVTETESRIGKFKRSLSPTQDVKTATGADNLRDTFRDLLGKPQFDGSVVFRNEPRLRPGQLMPVQIEKLGYDFVVQIMDVGFSTLNDGTLLAAVSFSVLKESFVSCIIPDQTNRAKQRGKRQVPEDAGPQSAWQI